MPPDCPRHHFMKSHLAISKKGGKAGRGAAKARTTEQARAAAQARWAKRKPKSGLPNDRDDPAGRS